MNAGGATWDGPGRLSASPRLFRGRHRHRVRSSSHIHALLGPNPDEVSLHEVLPFSRKGDAPAAGRRRDAYERAVMRFRGDASESFTSHAGVGPVPGPRLAVPRCGEIRALTVRLLAIGNLDPCDGRAVGASHRWWLVPPSRLDGRGTSNLDHTLDQDTLCLPFAARSCSARCYWPAPIWRLTRRGIDTCHWRSMPCPSATYRVPRVKRRYGSWGAG